MKIQQINFKNNIRYIILILIAVLYLISIIRNIGYPLLWNDEAETIVYGSRIIKYGYPKVSDGKNAVYLLEDKQKYGINKKYDAYLGSGWLQYYFSIPGILIADKIPNLYQKTAILRIPFVFIGFAGLLLYLFLLQKLLNEKKLVFWGGILFYIFTISSVSLYLHLREARYFSLSLFLLAIYFIIDLKHFFFREISFKKYLLFSSLLILLIFNTYYPISIIIIIFSLVKNILLNNKIKIFKNKFSLTLSINIPKIDQKNFISFFVWSISIMPLVIFFHNWQISKELSNIYHYSVYKYFNNLLSIIIFYCNYEFLYLLIFLKILLVYFSKYIKSKYFDISKYFTIFIITYCLIIARSPMLFERYYIILQPIITIIIILDIFTLTSLYHNFFKKLLPGILLLFLLILFSRWSLYSKWYEGITKPYKGPLDFIILYIQKNYQTPKNLTIATNYEETSYIYYLNCKIEIGYLGNFPIDKKRLPDFIIYRRNYNQYQNQFLSILSKHKYQKIYFPIIDYPYNNIPELNFPQPHLFSTPETNIKEIQLSIYKKNNRI